MTRARCSNFEALRLLGMIGIVLHHYSGVTKWQWSRECENYQWFNEFLINCMSTTGKIGVDIFLLMTGYFLNGKGLKPTSIARTWFQTVNWSYICFIPAFYLGLVKDFEYKLALSPIICHGYWFVASYIAAGMCTGWVAAIANHASRAQYLAGLVALSFVMMLSRWPMEISFSNVHWFVFVIALGAYMKRYQSEFMTIRTKTLVLVLVWVSIINYSSVYYFTFNEVKWAKDRRGPNALARENWSLVSLIYAVCLHLLVQRWDFNSATVNRLAGCTLGVYLTHENMFVQPRIWSQWVQGFNHRDSPWLPIIAPLQVAGVYTVCTLCELLRQMIFGHVEEYVSVHAGNYVSSLAERLNDEPEDEKDMV